MRKITNYPDRTTFFGEVAKLIIPTDRVLDLGCGIKPMSFFTPKTHVLVEPFWEYLELLMYNYGSLPQMVVINSDAGNFTKTLPDASFDSVFLLDVIEHLPKDQGLALIQDINRIARKQSVVFTPLGFEEQDCESEEVDGWGLSGTSMQHHRSGWLPDDFPDDWTFHVCQDFHEQNWKGEKVKPFGAFFAIKTRHPSETIPLELSPQQQKALGWMPLIKTSTSAPPDSLEKESTRHHKIQEKLLAKITHQLGKLENEILELRNRPRGFKRLWKNTKKAFTRRLK